MVVVEVRVELAVGAGGERLAEVAVIHAGILLQVLAEDAGAEEVEVLDGVDPVTGDHVGLKRRLAYRRCRFFH